MRHAIIMIQILSDGKGRLEFLLVDHRAMEPWPSVIVVLSDNIDDMGKYKLNKQDCFILIEGDSDLNPQSKSLPPTTILYPLTLVIIGSSLAVQSPE